MNTDNKPINDEPPTVIRQGFLGGIVGNIRIDVPPDVRSSEVVNGKVILELDRPIVGRRLEVWMKAEVNRQEWTGPRVVLGGYGEYQSREYPFDLRMFGGQSPLTSALAAARWSVCARIDSPEIWTGLSAETSFDVRRAG